MLSSEQILALQEVLGYKFNNSDILIQALTHKTFAYESNSLIMNDNERLEFLGDSVLGLVVAEYFYKQFPNFNEGDLTRRRALLVNKTNLAQKAKDLNLSNFLIVGKGELKTGGKENATNLACALEAIIGAIYLDGGLTATNKFILDKIVSVN